MCQTGLLIRRETTKIQSACLVTFGLILFSCLYAVSGQLCDNPASRQACGFIGIDKAGCLSAGCCWDATTTPPNPFCYQAAATTAPTGPTTTLPLGSTGAYSLSFPFSGGLPFCSQFGAQGQYACSGTSSWNSSFAFTDRTPKGSLVTAITVELDGSYGCDFTGSFQALTFLNNIVLS